MVDLEQRVLDLEKKVSDLELNINKSLSEIKESLVEICTTLKDNASSSDLKLIEKDVNINKEEIKELKSNQSKIVWTIVLAVIGLVGKTVIYYLQNNP
jgi:uncharacterized phage infection (PIP) family protein YhgE